MDVNNGGVREGASGREGRVKRKQMMEIGRSAENAFYAFLELVSDVLGFTAKTTTKKNEVGEYFNSLGIKLEKASEELEKVVNKAASGVDKSDESKNAKNPIRIAVDTAKTTLSILKGYVESLAKIGDSEKVGEAATDKEGAAPADVELKKAYNALKGIVDTADKEGVEKLVAGDVAVKVGDNGTDNKDGVKILATVVGNKPGNQDAGKAAAVAGGIALRSLVKDGKLAFGAADGSAGGKEEVQAVGISAVNKLLVAVEEMVKKTVKNVLEKVKQEVDKARDPKAVGQQ
ncbi:variable large family protein [Borrelia hispanica]|uniref:variable large family protein n=1 Tax=Borrelia hispanica TaxID=40835 RepID=UPI0006889652|nr:variable large family protein [Borrelia hispanica]